MFKAPTYLYKLIPSSRPELIPLPLPENLPLSELDSHSGFIHLSTASQVPETVERFFANEIVVHVLRLEYALLKKDIRWEDPSGESTPGDMGPVKIFPHLYNDGQLGRQEVESIFALERSMDESWDARKIQDHDWLLC